VHRSAAIENGPPLLEKGAHAFDLIRATDGRCTAARSSPSDVEVDRELGHTRYTLDTLSELTSEMQQRLQGYLEAYD